MCYNSFYEKWLETAKKLYPSFCISEEQLKKCVSPLTIKVSQKTLQTMTQTVKNIFRWSRSRIPSHSGSWICQAENDSILMAYDFHLDSKGCPQLIEINTNASGFLVVDLIDKVQGRQTQALDLLKKSFLKEWDVFSNDKTRLPHAVVLDQKIEEQKMKFEFFMYQDLIKSLGWSCDVVSVEDVCSSKDGRLLTPSRRLIDFIYNRLTDFYFEEYSFLKKAYQEKLICVSPNPKEYFLLGDKQNLCRLYSDLSQNNENAVSLHSIKDVIVKTFMMDQNSWSNRKNLFFKPLQGYGGKSAYKGASITRKKFNELKNCIAQEYIAPLYLEDSKTCAKWKADIRVYAYRDEVQLVGGRVYQGQLTNFRNTFGGFCSVLT